MLVDRSKEKLRMFGRPIVSKLKNEVAKIPKNLLRNWFTLITTCFFICELTVMYVFIVMC